VQLLLLEAVVGYARPSLCTHRACVDINRSSAWG